MKNLVLASALGTLAGGFAVPLLSGPVHYQVTKPHSMFAWLPTATSNPATVTVGTVPMDFVLTDVISGDINLSTMLIKANGNPVLCMGTTGVSSTISGHLHLTTGIPISSGATIVVDAWTSPTAPTPITLVGYLQ